MIRPVPASSVATLCGLAPQELAHLEPHEHEPLDRLADTLGRCLDEARSPVQKRKYADQQETLRALVRDPELSSEARGSVVKSWWSTGNPGYWLETWGQLTGAPRENLYRQAEQLLSFVPAHVRQGLTQLPPECSVNACRASLGADWVPPPDASHGELAAAAHASQCLQHVSFQNHATRMLKGLFAADMPAPYRQRGFEKVGDRLHELRMKDSSSYVAQVNQVLDHPHLEAEVRLAVLEQLGPELNVDHAIETATLRQGFTQPRVGITETARFVSFSGVVLRKRA